MHAVRAPACHSLPVRLLIVDDAPQMRRLLASLVSGVADAITECTNGADAIRCYFDEHPDWVLMDVRMEGLDGIAATREIVRRDPAARVVIVSDYDGAEIRQAVNEAGAVAYVHKGNLLGLRGVIAP